jgi:transposase-like protein
MHRMSSLSAEQREAAVAFFEEGLADRAAASMLEVSRWPVRMLYRRWRIHGRGALVRRPGSQPYSFEFKLDLVQRFLRGDGSAAALAQEHGLSSPKLLQTWVRAYRNGGVDALRPKPKGRPAKDDDGAPPREPSEVERLRKENERLKAENAYLKKVRALRAQGRQ